MGTASSSNAVGSKAAFATLVSIVALDAAAMSIVLPLVPFLALELGASAFQVTLVIGVYAAALFLGAPLMGALSDRFGRRMLLLATVCGMGAANLLLAFADSLWLVFVARAAAGLMAGNMTVAEALAANNSSDAERPKAMAMVGMAMAGGLVMGPLLSTAVLLAAPPGQELTVTFVGAAIVCGLAALALLAHWSRLREHVSASRPAGKGLRVSTAELLRSPAFLRLALCGAVAELGAMTSMALNALWLADRLGAGPALVGLHLSCIAGGMIAGQVLIVGGAGHRLGERQMLMLALALIATGYLALTFANVLWLTMPLFFIAYIGVAAVTATSLAGISRRVAPERQGAALGLANGIRGIIQLLAPAGAGLAFSAGLTDLPFQAVAAAAAVAAGLVLLPERVGPRPDAGP